MEDVTFAINAPMPRKDPYGALSMPVYHCCAYEFPDHKAMIESFTGVSDDPDYSRVTNPTVIHFENIIKSLTGARDVVAFTSGMAAISAAAMALTAAGKKIVTSRHLFGNTYLLFTSTLKRFGVETELVDLTDLEAVRRAVDEDTSMLYLETVSNPQMEICDVRALAEIAHAKGAAVVADTTMIPFVFADMKSLGVDVEILSSTKYLSGGATSLGGVVIDYGTIEGFDYRLRKDMLMNLGGYMSPHAAYMQTLGLETLRARYTVHEDNARKVAEGLEDIIADMERSGKVEQGSMSVCWPGLESNPYHELAKRQFGGHYSAMLTLTLPDEESCFRFIDKLKTIRRATNLFDNRSLAIHPASTIFGTIDAATRAAMDVSDRLIRLSIGLEDSADLLADLKQALG
ncbi:MAG: PLP-dependent aspartate aminotransferase family protein [Muribaculaceae bacterium]|nr:PLP-dependent aspartate aminotransferase family protein [Muribaculaceae bacterium]